MRIIGYFFVLFIFVSCNIKNEEAVEAPVIAIPEGSLNTDIGTISQTDTSSSNSGINKNSKLLLIARGSEPGWYAEFFEDHLRMLIDNGTDSLVVERDFSGINTDPMYNTPVSKNSSRNRERLAFTVSISNKKCVEEASGETREKQIIILYRSKQYKGCATANIN